MPTEIETIAQAIDDIWKVGESFKLDPFPIHEIPTARNSLMLKVSLSTRRAKSEKLGSRTKKH